MITLQINDSGSWRNLLRFAPERREEILDAAAKFASVLGGTTKWALLHADGRREWLHELGADFRQWHPITPSDPAPLVDVLISVYAPEVDEADTFMAYRKVVGGPFYMSGTDDQVFAGGFDVYAYARVPSPAQRVAA